MTFRLIAFLFVFINLSFSLAAQDTLTLMSGKTLIVKNVGLTGNFVSYETMKAKNKLKKLHAEEVFSVKYVNGTERIIYMPDSQEPDDYTITEMSMYIKGEQDAIKYYRNNMNKAGAFLFGAGSAYFSFYGIIGPAVYSTVIGSFIPDMSKQKVSDPALLQSAEYKNGYERKMRDVKTRNSILYGLAGLATGIVTYSIIGNNTK